MPKGRVSNVWLHYDINEECENFAICRYCGNNISHGVMPSNLKGNNTTNLWTHLRHKHSDEVLVSPVQQRATPRVIPIIKKGKTVRITKAKQLREPMRLAKPKIEVTGSYVGETGALPQKWVEYEQNDEISDDIKDITYSEDPLCYSPIHVMEDETLETGEKVHVVGSTSVVGTSRPSVAPVVASGSASSPAKQLKNNLETSIDCLTTVSEQLKNNLETSIASLTTVSEQLSCIIQQNHEEQSKDDYYFALSLVPIMRHLSINRKMYVRSKILELLFKESEGESVASKDE